jgi:hypothetical protein
MRLKIAALAVFLLAGLSVQAQENYTIAASAAQVPDLRLHVLGKNRETCRRVNAVGAPNCTQAAACTAVNAPGGSGCSNAQARQAGVRIWPDSEAGRQEFVTFAPGWVADLFKAARAGIPSQIAVDHCIWWGTLNQAQREAHCNNIGAANSGTIDACGLCP